VTSFEQGLDNPNVCSDGHKNVVSEPDGPDVCEGTYGISFNIGKYVGVSVTTPLESGYGIYNVAPVPLSLQGEKKELKEDLVLWWRGWISDVISPTFWAGAGGSGGMGKGSMDFYPNNKSAELELVTYINEASVKHAMKFFEGLDDSLYEFEDKEVGTLKLVCEDWNTTTPIYVIRRIKKETSCITNFEKDTQSNSSNGLHTLKVGAPALTCNGAPDGYYCCSEEGCGGVKDTDPCCEEEFCRINYPCSVGWVITGRKSPCAANAKITCGGGLTKGDYDDLLCGCCGCTPEKEQNCKECEKGPQCKPYNLTEDFKELACYGPAHEKDKIETKLDLTITFKLFTEME